MCKYSFVVSLDVFFTLQHQNRTTKRTNIQRGENVNEPEQNLSNIKPFGKRDRLRERGKRSKRKNEIQKNDGHQIGFGPGITTTTMNSDYLKETKSRDHFLYGNPFRT